MKITEKENTMSKLYVPESPLKHGASIMPTPSDQQ